MAALTKTFSVVKSAASTVDNFSGAFKSLKSISKISDTASLLKKMDFDTIAGTFSSVASTTKRTSSLADTAKTLNKFSSLIPSSTDDILGSVSTLIKKSDDVSVIKTVSSLDIDPKFIQNVADTNSLSKLKKISVSISTSTPSVSGLSRRSSSILSQGDNLKIVTKSIDKVDDVEDVASVLKKGKGTLSKLDEVGDAGTFTKKTKTLDDAAGSSTSLKKLNKGVDFIEKHAGTVNLAIMGFFFLGQAHAFLQGRSDNDVVSEDDPLLLVTDPGSDVYDVERFGSTIITDEEGISVTETLLQKEIIIAFIVAMSIITLV